MRRNMAGSCKADDTGAGHDSPPATEGNDIMDIYGCLAPDTKIDTFFMWFTAIGLVLSVIAGLPFIIWVGLVGQYL